MLVIIDNYDSFTYNLVQYFGEFGIKQVVVRNDRTTVAEIRRLKPEAIVISPGPCTPKQAGISVGVIQQLHQEIPILGVCLGHQAIGEAFGAKVVKASAIFHGKTSPIVHSKEGLFKGIPSPFLATRYHSLVIDTNSLPSDLVVTAWTEDGMVMGLRHKQYPTMGVQFHPESFATQYGKRLLKNFLIQMYASTHRRDNL